MYRSYFDKRKIILRDCIKGDLFRIYFSFRIDGKLTDSCIFLFSKIFVEKIFVATMIS